MLKPKRQDKKTLDIKKKRQNTQLIIENNTLPFGESIHCVKRPVLVYQDYLTMCFVFSVAEMWRIGYAKG